MFGFMTLRSVLVVVFVVGLLPVAVLAKNSQKPKWLPASGYDHKLTEQQKKQIRLALMSDFAKAVAKIKSVSDYDRLLLSSASKSDRRDMMELAKTNFIVPKVEMKDETVILSGDGEKLSITWTGFPESRFSFNGVEWTFTRKQPLKWQLTTLAKKLEMQSKRSSALRLLVLPEAHALGPVPLLLFGVAINQAITVTPTVYCWAVVKQLERTGSWYDWCSSYKKEVAQEQRETKSVPVDTLKKNREEAAEETLRFLPQRGALCPSKSDKTQNVFDANVQEVTISNGKIGKFGDVIAVRVSFNENGVPVEGLTGPVGTRLDTPEGQEKMKTHLKFDDKGLLKDVLVPNPGGSPPVLPIDMATDDTKLTVEQRAVRDQTRALLKSINDWMALCVQMDLIRQVREKNSEGRSQGPVQGPPMPGQEEQAPNPEPVNYRPSGNSPAKTVN